MPATLNRWSFRGHLLNRPEMRVRQMTGLLGLPPMRGEDFLTMGLTGRLFVPKIPDARRIGLELLLTDAIYRGQIPAMLDELAGIFADRAQGDLVHYHPDGTIRTAQAEVAAWQPADSKANIGALYLGIADFSLAYPWFLGASQSTTGMVPSSPTSFDVVNPGSVQATQIVLDYLGPIANPVLTNNTNGVAVTCNVTVAAGTHLLIDCGAFTATNDAANAIASILHSGSLAFMALEPGTNSLTVTGTGMTGATSLTATFAPPYE